MYWCSEYHDLKFLFLNNYFVIKSVKTKTFEIFFLNNHSRNIKRYYV